MISVKVSLMETHCTILYATVIITCQLPVFLLNELS